MACLYTTGISSGRLRMERVVAAMKYQVFLGRCGCLRIEVRRDGVMMAGRAFMAAASGCLLELTLLDDATRSHSQTPLF